MAENTSLEMHVELCVVRYEILQEKISAVEERLAIIHNDFATFKTENQQNLNDIKHLLHGAKDEKFKIMITSTATIIVGLLAMLGYMLINLPK